MGQATLAVMAEGDWPIVFEVSQRRAVSGGPFANRVAAAQGSTSGSPLGPPDRSCYQNVTDGSTP